MDDSDDYFTDDFLLDDKTLAILDEAEHKFASTSTQPTRTKETTPPPAKRQRTQSGYRPGTSVQRSNTLEELDGLPEISVRDDGFYNVQLQPQARQPPPVVEQSRSNFIKEKPPSSSSAVSAPQAPPKPPSQSRNTFTPRNRQVTPTSVQRASQIRQIPRAAHVPQIPVQNDPKPTINEQVEAFRRQMEELKKENEKMQSALKDATEVRFAKEGEVSILRKGIQKTAQDHATQVAKLKAAKEEGDAKQQQMQREMKEEMERLKTQFTFRQHELETANRKPPWSGRLKKTGGTEPNFPPVPIPSQMRGWNQNPANAGPSRHPMNSQNRPRFEDDTNDSPKHQQVRKPRISDRDLPPGFQTSPRPSQSYHAQGKGKGKEIVETSHMGSRSLFFSNLDRPSQSYPGGLPPSPPSSPFLRVLDIGTQSRHIEASTAVQNSSGNEVDRNEVDFEMLDGTSGDPKDVASEVVEGDLLNWSIYLHRGILRHTMFSSSISTFQMLMQVSLPSSFPHTFLEKYTSASSRILDIVSITPTRDEWNYTVSAVCESMLQMAELLLVADLILALTALLNLLTYLVCTIPTFSVTLVSVKKEGENAEISSFLLSTLCDIIRTFVRFKATGAADDMVTLAKETMGLFESLSWQLPPDSEDRLATVVRSPETLSILLDSAQPPWLLYHSVNILVWLATRKNLFRILLSFPESEIPGEDAGDFTMLPHIAALCSMLVDSSRGHEMIPINESILTFFAILSQSHTDALTMLLESRTLVPSLITFLMRSSTPLWEDDEALIPSAPRTIRTVNQALFLLHTLVFGLEVPFNLRHKLQVTPSRQFNGITHMFILTLGRLSYLDPPEWITSKDKAELEHMADMARELLDLVAEGPEGDSIWATYQEGPEQAGEMDDEEAEARRLVADTQ